MTSIAIPCSGVGISRNRKRLPRNVQSGAVARTGATMLIGSSRIA